MEHQVIEAALAGLLHDIGKFSQRAGVGPTETGKEATDRDYGYRHASDSHGFMAKFVPEAWRPGLSGVAYHHRPKSKQDYWVQRADQLSAAEREADEDMRVPHMLSPFSRLAGHHSDNYLPLQQLDPLKADSLFAKPMPAPAAGEWRKEWQDEYVELWKAFTAECQSAGLNALTDKTVYLETIYALLQDFTWSMPSAYDNNVPDVSLFDHLRTTAAIAACLAADDRSVEWCEANGNGETVCYLVGADLSGLQNFIYTLASSGALKSLRARSFYVQMITEALALAMLEQLHLPLTNLIYAGGGGFQLLAPVKAKDGEDGLDDIVCDLADRLLEVHQGALGLTVKWEPVTSDDFAHFNTVRERLGRTMNKAKRQPFAVASAAALAKAIGVPLTQGGEPEKFCKVTGEDGDTLEQDEDGVYKSLFVLSLEELGRQLPFATHLVVSPVNLATPGRATDWRDALRVFGYDVQVVTNRQPTEQVLSKPGQAVRVWRLLPKPDRRAEAAALVGLKGQTTVISYRPFAKLTPVVAGRPITTDELAEKSTGGFKRWGVLRLDVDNLGKLFRDGFADNATLSRVSSLSFALRLFFEGWLPKLAEATAEHPQDLTDRIYSQYSGGDDLFVIGAWDALPEFALRIRESFRKYVTGDHITLSGGMTMIEAGFPLYQAAREAGEAEEEAKHFERDVPRKKEDEVAEPNAKARRIKKDAFTFLGQPMTWEMLAQTRDLASRLTMAIDDLGAPRAALQTMLSLDAQIQQTRKAARKLKKDKPQYGRWMWMAAYQLTRLMPSDKKEDNRSQTIRKLFGGIQSEFLKPGGPTIPIGLAARWAQYLTRGG